MSTSNYTKNLIRKLWLYRIIDWLLLLSPILIYFFMAMASGQVTTVQKVTLCGSGTVALILVIINVLAQKHIRCSVWIVLLGLYIAFKEYLLPLVIILAIVSILDDFCLKPIIDYYKAKVIASKTIDEREGENE